MASVLLAWELGGGAGHLHPLGCIARGLAARGHRVVLAVRELKTAGELLPDLQLLQAPVWRGRLAKEIPAAASYGELLMRVGFLDPDFVEGQTRSWQQLFRLAQPDLLLCDHSPGALLAARAAGLPAASCGSGFLVPPDRSPLPSLQPWKPITRERLAQAETQMLRPINRALTRLAAAPLNALCELFQGPIYLNTFPELDHYGIRENTRYWGLIQSNPEAAEPVWPAGEGPKLFVYFPHHLLQFPALAEAIKRLDYPALWVSRGIPDALVKKVAAPHIRFSDELAQLELVAQQAALVINRVNHGTVAEMLRQGCRQLVIHQYIEQAMLAHRLVQQGLAMSANGDQPERYEKAIQDALASPQLGQACQDFSRRYIDWQPEQQLAAMLDDLEQQLLPGGA